MKANVHTTACTWVILAALLIKSPKWKNTHMSIMGEVKRWNVSHSYQELFGRKEINAATYNNMHEPRKKPVTKDRVPGKIPFISKSRRGQSARDRNMREVHRGGGKRRKRTTASECGVSLWGVINAFILIVRWLPSSMNVVKIIELLTCCRWTVCEP